MQEAEKISVENRPKVQAPEGSAHRLVPIWQCLLLVILFLLHWQTQYQFRVPSHHDMNAWQERRGGETKRSNKRGEPSVIKVGIQKGRGNMQSTGQYINLNQKYEINAVSHVVHDIQNGKRCKTRNDQRCRQFGSNPVYFL